MNLTQDLINQLNSGDDHQAETAAAKIAGLGPDAIPILQPLFSSPDPDTRWWALRTISEIPSPNTSPTLIKALVDTDPSVRQCAALGLRLHPYPDGIARLINALGDRDRLFASLAADALVAIGDPAVPELIKTMENGSQLARLETVRALALIGDKRAIPVLFNSLDEGSALMEYWAGEGLERMGVGMTFFSPGQ